MPNAAIPKDLVAQDSAGAPEVPADLMMQLADEGTLVIPVGALESQELLRISKRHGKTTREVITGCVFVPLVGDEGWMRAESPRTVWRL